MPDTEKASAGSAVVEQAVESSLLDQIVETGKYEAPDAFMDLQLATQLTVQYINLYLAANLEEKKADMLRLFFKQCQALIQAATPPPAPAPVPQANPEPAPTSPLIPNSPNQQAA